MFVRRRWLPQTTPTVSIFELRLGNLSDQLVFPNLHLHESPPGSTASLSFVIVLSTIFGLIAIISLCTVFLWCHKKNKVFPMNKCEISADYGSNATIIANVVEDYDNISQTTEIIENFESCLSKTKGKMPERAVRFLLDDNAQGKYYENTNYHPIDAGKGHLGCCYRASQNNSCVNFIDNDIIPSPKFHKANPYATDDVLSPLLENGPE